MSFLRSLSNQTNLALRKYLLLFCTLFFFGNLSAQEIGGKVLDAFTNKPLEGVKITSEELQVPVYSDASGNFSVAVEELPINLIFEYSGYGRKNLVVETYDQDLRVFLAPSEGSLSEVVLRSTIIPQELLRTPAAVSV